MLRWARLRAPRAVGAGDTLSDEIAARRHRDLQLIAHPLARLPERQAIMPFLCVAGESAGVDRIAFADCAERTDEGFDLAGIGTMNGTAGANERVEKPGFMAAGCFTYDKAGCVEPGSEGIERIALVRHSEAAIGARIEHRNGALADIAADEAVRGVVRSIIAGYP